MYLIDIRFIKLRAYIYIQHKLADYLSLKYGCKIHFCDSIISPVLQDSVRTHKSDTYGAYSAESKAAIVYTSAIPSLKVLVMSCFHEYRHGVQHQKLLSSEEYHFWTYLTTMEDPTGAYYKFNPLEIDAFVFAATLGKMTSLSEILALISKEEASSLLKDNNIDMLKRRLFLSSSEYHQIAESTPSLAEICLLFCDLIIQKLRNCILVENSV